MIVCLIGTTEIILIAAMVLLLFGGKKLPELLNGLGKGVRNFKEGLNQPTEEELNRRVDEEVKRRADAKEVKDTIERLTNESK